MILIIFTINAVLITHASTRDSLHFTQFHLADELDDLSMTPGDLR